MRAKAIPAPSRKGKRRLLESCAIMAGLAALAYGGPALAQVAGTGQAVTGPGLSIPVISTPVTGATSVDTTGAQTIINWTPTDTATTGGAIDFLPTGNTLTFNGTGNYTVLNRFVNGAGGSLSRQIALNGTINSTNSAASGTRGGNIWFYNAGGILIGATGVINVGSLVLTTNDVLTTGGLFGPSGEIRFRGAANSTAAITVNGTINADYTTNPGGAYVALVAPRVVQSGNVRVDGSAAYVAAEQADVRINGGLFDINVLVGAEGGNAITHTGDTTGPAHQQGDTDQSRIYMVAIPKNDAVTMLVSGQVGYDDALSAQIDPDGVVRLSAGYNVTNGELNAAPANATAANITVNDTLFRSNIIARASGAFVGQPLQLVPTGAPGPVPPPPEQGRIFVEGDGIFIGDASATFNVGAGQIAGATGNFAVQSGGVGGAPGSASIVVNGGLVGAGGDLTVNAQGAVDPASGFSQGGTASLTVANAGLAGAVGNVIVSADGIGGFDTGGQGGNGVGGTATITVSGAGSFLTGATIGASASGLGGGVVLDPVNGAFVANNGGDGTGGSATVSVQNGGSLSGTAAVVAVASGTGQTGLVQSGDGQGGSARVEVTGLGTSLQTPQTLVVASGGGGGSFSASSFGTFVSQNAGSGRGGAATLSIDADATAAISAGVAGVAAGGAGGSAGGENSVGGNGQGGTASVTGAGGAIVQFDSLSVSAGGTGGSSSSLSALTASSGGGIGGDVGVTATGGTTLAINANLTLTANGLAGIGDTVGSGDGGTVAVSVESGGNINVNDQLIVGVVGGSFGPAVLALDAGSGTGGDVDLTAIGGGAIRADSYLVSAAAGVVNVTGTNGAAQGGTIDVTASSTGQILATNDGNHFFDTSAATGVSTGGSSATGGTIRFIADAGAINMGAGATLAAGGVSGGATNPGPNSPVGSGGSILVQLVADALDSSAISLGGFTATTDGRTAIAGEGAVGLPNESAGIGQGGTISFDVQGGTLTASGINVSADGFGGNVAGGNAGFGGTASFTQTGGNANVGSLIVSADGFGGVTSGQSGSGIGGTTTVDLLGGAIDASGITATANGRGGQGFEGNDDDPANIIAGGQGGNALGGTATVNIAGSAIVSTETISANAAGFGGIGGDFVNVSSFGGVPGTPGNGGDGVGGTATVEVTGGTTAATGMIANASGIGGDGGSSFFSSSSGGATGVGVGGRGGIGQGGTATVALQTAIDAVGTASSIASGIGGNGGDHNVGGAGGDGFGGIAQAIVTNFDAGQLAVTLDTTGLGGGGADGRDGAGGEGGDGIGGTSRLFADGPDASVTVTAANFITGGTGGNGGNAQLGFGSFVLTAPSGGHGGDGRGGTIEVIANEGATVSLGIPAGGGGIVFDAISAGGNGGNGADSVFDAEALSGDGGIGGGGYGGTVRLLTNGGTITSNGAAVAINATGAVGTGGAGGIGQGGGSDGASGGSFGTIGGRVLIEALNGLTGPGQIALGNTSINANGDIAGRIELRAEGNLGFRGLAAEALGFADPTNNDTSDAPAGIFLAMTGGTIASQGDVTLTTDSSVGAYAQSNGIFDVAGALTIDAGDQIDIRHEFREGLAPTIRTSGSLFATALTSISGAPGSLLGAGDTLSLTTTGVTGGIGLDRLDGVDIVLGSNGAVSVEHAEATNDFTANGASFRTGLNSIITGGDISVTSTGAVDLGNSTAGGFVSVEGQRIAFDTIGAGTTVSLRAQGFGAGDGIDGNAIAAGGDVALTGRTLVVDNIQTDGSLSASASNGQAILGSVNTGGHIAVFANGNVIGTFAAGGNISLRSAADIIAAANATGGYVDPATGLAAEGSVLANADGNLTMVGSAATMFGARAGGSVALENVTAGEDVFVLAGTTANLTAITAGDDLSVRADGAIDLSNAQTTGAGPDGRSVVYQACCSNPIPFLQIQTSAADLSNVTLLAPASTIRATDVTAFDNFTATASGAVTTTGLIRSGLATNITGSSLNLVAVTAGTDILLTANTGGVSATGALAAGHDVGVTAIGAVNGSEFDAGDDIRVTTNGALTIGAAYSYGTGIDNEGDGSNIVLAAGATDVTHAEADNDFIAEAASFTTGLDSIITGGDINIAAAGAVDLGNSTAGGFVQVNGQSIAFNNINAGTTVGLNATGTAVGAEGISGGSITAGGSVNLFGNSIAITGAVDSAASLFASANGGNAAIELADVDGNIVVVTDGDIGGSYAAGGNITLTAGGNIVAQANAAGGYVDPNSIASEGYVFADADGNAMLTNSSAATMLGVRAGQTASVSSAVAGEDVFVIAGTTATLANITAGDDATATAPGGITANGITTTGAGPDNRMLIYGASAAGTNIWQIATAAADLSNITLIASAGNIGGGNLSAFDNLTATASGTVTTTGLLRSGLATTVSGSALSFNAIAAGTDADLTATTGGIAATGVVAAGHDLTIDAAGNVGVSELRAGDDIRVDAGGTLAIGAAYAYGTGIDDEGNGNGSNIVIAAGATNVDHAEAGNDFVVDAASFRTGLNSIIAGGNIDITTAGASDLGNATAGGSIAVDAQSIAFDALDAGTTIDLSAGGTAAGIEGIDGGTIVAGGDINLGGNSIALTGMVTGDASLFAASGGGPVAINQANINGNIVIDAAGNLTGTYAAGGDIRLNSGANVNASATTGGTAGDGNLFVDAAGNVVLADSAAARMFGVNAGGSATITGASAGEDFLALAGTTASLTDITAGDDIDIRAAGNLTANNVTATGAGADTHLLNYLPANGFTIMQGEGVSAVNGSDVFLSAGGSIGASALSAGDDIVAIAGATIAIAGADTLGLGITGGGSNIRTQGGDTTLSGIDAFDDLLVDADGLADLTGPVAAGRNAAIDAGSVSFAVLTDSGGAAIPTLRAGGDVVVNSAAGITGGGVRALGDAVLTAGTAIGIASVEGQDVTLTGAAGITVDAASVLGTTTLDSSDGDIRLASLVASGPINASANAIRIESGGNMHFATLTTDIGDAYVRGGGDFSVASGTVAGTADLVTQGEAMNIGNLTAADAIIANAGGFLNLDTVTVAGSLDASARTSLGINGVVTGRSISLASAGIGIASTGRVGTAGTTESVAIANNSSDNQTFIGGTGTPDGYHLDADELTRVFGTEIEIFAPEVQVFGGLSVGSATPPDVIVDGFTMTGGTSTSNLGANGALTIRTPGKMRVVGNVQLTGLTDANTLNLVADRALEIILGRGTVRLVSGTNPAGQLNMVSDDIIVATEAAIADVGAATTTDAIETRLAENDGVLLDEGALSARGIRAEVVGGFYVQNSGTGTRFADRRGLTFGAGGLDVLTEGPSRIVINGVHLGPNGRVTGLDTIPLLTIAGSVPAPGSFDPRSTFNGCLITGAAACTVLTLESNFPVQDVIEDEADPDGDDGDGNILPTPLITMRDLDPLSGEPLLDDPVTGAGNDDLWTPTLDACDPASAAGGSCPAAE